MNGRALVPALLVALSPAGFAQKLSDRSKPRNHPVNCPWTGGDAEMLARIGVLSISGFEFGTYDSTEKADEYFAGDDIKWVETAHFRIGFGLASYKVPGGTERNKLRAELEHVAGLWPEAEFSPKTRIIDPWMRAYLFAIRAEKLWDEFLVLLDVEESDFPDEATTWDTTGKYMGQGPYLGEKGKYEVLFLPSEVASKEYLRTHFGLLMKLTQRWNIIEKDTLHMVIHTRQGDLKKDTALHGHFVFNMVLQMLNGYKHYSYDSPVWLMEGIAHWFERQVSPEYNTFDSSEGAVAEMTKKSNWEPPTRRLVSKDDYIPMARLVNMKGYAELTLEHHYTTWSMIDYLQRVHPGPGGMHGSASHGTGEPRW